MEELVQLQGFATVILVVNGLPISLELNGTGAPITAGNFVDLVERDFYDGITFHRVVLEPTPFVAQAGDPNSRDPNFPPDQLGSAGFIDPATGQERTIPLEILPQGATEPIIGQTFAEAGVTVPPVLQNQRGTIAMARTDDPNSASSQFFINLTDSDFLDGRFAVFGQVVNGVGVNSQAVVDQIAQGDRIIDAEVVDGIVATRSSQVVTDPFLLNTFVNLVNKFSLPLQFFTTRNLDADNVVTIPPEIAIQATRGVLTGGGNDLVTGSVENDVINGNQGNDTITGNVGNDYIFGGQDNDSLSGSAGNDILNGNRGNDVIFGGTNGDYIRGGQGNDNLNGNAGNDLIIGDLGTDTLTGEAGADTFLLRVDEAAGVRDPNLADRIVDLNLSQGDRLGIVGSISLSSLRFNAVSGGTSIQLANGDILGQVLNVQPGQVQTAVFIAPADDLGLTIG
ncbi:MAG: peptidylprolyl isomerase [Oscillatoriales cyanobacterium RM1_1_9]|nr:peptidylprolyl isomerase [Oscillatoriales cyanobacterium SM2_3_0]NJO47238.1 peptidylprolyl isomerase [Oscillatoriales cyanobacterium RM2_1_1]NJO70911.1 peptidylprolyl isomerase [Oscillatoriales cyanobacterium RM1_1_9]